MSIGKVSGWTHKERVILLILIAVRSIEFRSAKNAVEECRKGLTACLSAVALQSGPDLGSVAAGISKMHGIGGKPSHFPLRGYVAAERTAYYLLSTSQLTMVL